MYIRLSEAEIEHSDEVEAGIILDYDIEDRLVAIEILDVRKRVAPPFTIKGELEIDMPAQARDA
ncbi:MAG TPA: DUF2283 domain-containing protein [Alphaproteobacteria bacterium]|nr:DUF2283 domain-containing protein [Alphaproteobacteria bacterium]